MNIDRLHEIRSVIDNRRVIEGLKNEYRPFTWDTLSSRQSLSNSVIEGLKNEYRPFTWDTLSSRQSLSNSVIEELKKWISSSYMRYTQRLTIDFCRSSAIISNNIDFAFISLSNRFLTIDFFRSSTQICHYQ